MEDLYASYQQGMVTGGSVDEAFDVFKMGASIDDKRLQDFIDAANEMEKIGPTNEQIAFQRAQKEAGGGIFGTMSALADNPGVFSPEVSSFVRNQG